MSHRWDTGALFFRLRLGVKLDLRWNFLSTVSGKIFLIILRLTCHVLFEGKTRTSKQMLLSFCEARKRL